MSNNTYPRYLAMVKFYKSPGSKAQIHTGSKKFLFVFTRNDNFIMLTSNAFCSLPLLLLRFQVELYDRTLVLCFDLKEQVDSYF